MSADYDVPVARVRKSTVSRGRGELSKSALAIGRTLYPEDTREGRPVTYGDCQRRGLGGSTPCPYASCAHHLALDVRPDTGAITTNFPGRDLDELPATCDLAVAEVGGLTLEEVGVVMNLTREGVRQIEIAATRKLASLLGAGYEDLATDAMGSRPAAVAKPVAVFSTRLGDRTVTGQRFGRLVVLSFGQFGRYSAAEVRCDCGTVCVKRLSSLRTGHTKSCGCLGRSGAAL